MNKLAMTQAIMVAKETKELTWEKLVKPLVCHLSGRRQRVWV